MRVDAPGITYIYGRQTCDTRIVDGGAIDAGNAQFAGQEALIVFEDVFVPLSTSSWTANGPSRHAGRALHVLSSPSYVCKTGLGDVLIGAAATAADYNGVEKVRTSRTSWSR